MEMKEGVKREKRRVRREWYGKNWKWVVSYVIPGLILAIVLYSISISFIVSKLQQSTVFHLKLCVSFSITENMTELVVPSNRCNSEKMNTLDLSLFPQLKSIVIGDDCFMNVGQLNLNGLSKLETVVIGINSFTRNKNGFGRELNRRFNVTNCNLLKEIRIGIHSISDYSSAVIENNELLERIVIGEVNQSGYSFYSASLKLRSMI